MIYTYIMRVSIELQPEGTFGSEVVVQGADIQEAMNNYLGSIAPETEVKAVECHKVNGMFIPTIREE